MHHSLRFVALLSLGGALAASATQACGGASDSDLFVADGGGGDDAGQGSDGTTGHDGGNVGDGSTTHDGATGNDGSTGNDSGPCVGLQCQVPTCDGGATTKITGTVTDPAKINPVYNAIVYVPNAMVPDLPVGPTCEVCGARPPGGQPIVLTLSAADGTFTLSNVPAGTDIPLVVQIGKWRRVVKIPTVTACVDNALEKELTRLPKRKSEGSLPQIAVATGGCDQLECVLRKMGVDDAEFTVPTGTGSVHVYVGNGGGSVLNSPAATTLWSSPTALAKYDMVLNGCECMADEVSKPRTSIQNMADYASLGGRWLGTHYQNYWLRNAPFPIPYTAAFSSADGFGTDSLALNVNTTMPKGQAFAAWLVAVGASTTSGVVTLDTMRHNTSAVTAPSTMWLSGNDSMSNPPAEVALYTFNTPFPSSAVDAGVVGDAAPWGDAGHGMACGKIGYADFHASMLSATPGVFPSECSTTPMTNDEKALEFTLFDLGGCVQDDTMAPKMPPLR